MNTNKTLKYNSLADLLPCLTNEEFQALKSDIEKNGLQQPIIVRHDEILDGRHRYEACRALGLEPKIVEMDDLSDDQALQLVVSANVHRRHLTSAQRTLIALRLTRTENSPLTQKQAAALTGITDRTIRDLATALKKKPELEQAILNGMSVNLTKQVSDMDEADQEKVLEAAHAHGMTAAKQKARTIESKTTKRRSPKQPSSKSDEGNYFATHDLLIRAPEQLEKLITSHSLTVEEATQFLDQLKKVSALLEEFLARKQSDRERYQRVA